MTSRLVDTPIRIDVEDRNLVTIDRYVLDEGRITFLFGESGIGKTLAAKSVFGLLDADKLKVTLNGVGYDTYLRGRAARAIRDKGFFVFQEPSSHLNPVQTLGRQLREGSIRDDDGEEDIFDQLWHPDRRMEVRTLLRLFPEPVRPSGGEKQRFLLAMAFKKMLQTLKDDDSRRGLFVFDEPTGSLDDNTRDRFLQYLMYFFSSGRLTGLVMTHDYSMVSMLTRPMYADRGLVDFKELTRIDRTLVMRTFDPAEYTEWLKQMRREAQPGRMDAETLVSVRSGIQVHGRRLRFSPDPSGSPEDRLFVRRGRMTYLKAPSGTGKTTLAKTMLGLLPVRKFRMRVGKEVLTERTPYSYWRRHLLGRRMTMSFQHADESLSLQATVDEAFDGLPVADGRGGRRTREVLRLLFDPQEIESFRGRRLRTLSGGQKQKLNLLRCLVLDANIVILDEPLNGLDLESAKKILGLIRVQKLGGKGFLVISHNEEIFDAQADDILYLHQERAGL